MNGDYPKMSYKKKGIEHSPLKTFQVNESTIIAIYEGSLSPFDILNKIQTKTKKWEMVPYKDTQTYSLDC